MGQLAVRSFQASRGKRKVDVKWNSTFMAILSDVCRHWGVRFAASESFPSS